jgi:hypothetical protein
LGQQRNTGAELSHGQDDEDVGEQTMIGVGADRCRVNGTGADSRDRRDRRRAERPPVDGGRARNRRFPDLGNVSSWSSVIAFMPMCN